MMNKNSIITGTLASHSKKNFIIDKLLFYSLNRFLKTLLPWQQEVFVIFQTSFTFCLLLEFLQFQWHSVTKVSWSSYFENWWYFMAFPVPWLNHMKFFQWGYLKFHVYNHIHYAKLHTLDELKTTIYQAIT